MPQFIIYTPFPHLSRREHNELANQATAHKDSLVSYGTLPFHYTNDEHGGWNKFTDHTHELKMFATTHKKELAKIDIEADSAQCPNVTASGDFPQVLSKYNLNNTDVILIHCHGNTEVLGTGGFTLNPQQLAQHMLKLGLPKTDPPVLVVWACKSGVEDTEVDSKSYAELFRNELKLLNYQNLAVCGIAATIIVTYGPNTGIAYELDNQTVPETLVTQILMSPVKQKNLTSLDPMDVFNHALKISQDLRAFPDTRQLRTRNIAATSSNQAENKESKSESIASKRRSTQEFSSGTKINDAEPEAQPGVPNAPPSNNPVNEVTPLASSLPLKRDRLIKASDYDSTPIVRQESSLTIHGIDAINKSDPVKINDQGNTPDENSSHSPRR